jgi:subtilisin family serine protease
MKTKLMLLATLAGLSFASEQLGPSSKAEAIRLRDTAPGESPVRTKTASTPQVAASSKIGSALRTAAETGNLLSVVIVLADQPQAQIFKRIEGGNVFRMQMAENEFKNLAGQPFPSEEQLRQAQSRLEDLVLENRQSAAREIESAVRPRQDSLISRIEALGATNLQRYLAINMISADIPASALSVLEADPAVAEVFLSEQDGAQLDISVPVLGAPAFWKSGFSGKGQAVAVLDTGLKTNHPAFSGLKVVNKVFLGEASRSACFADNPDSPEDLHGHGTHVAGIIASQGTSAFPSYQGVAKGIGTLYNLKIGAKQKETEQCGGQASSSNIDVLNAIEWAVFNTPVKIFNYSYGGTVREDDSPLARGIDWISDTYGVTIVVSAGNEGPNPQTVSSPGMAYNILSVANWDDNYTLERRDDFIARSSSRGPTFGGRMKPDIAAPGSHIASAAHNNNGFVRMSGTSMAAPHITGAVALIEQAGVTEPLAVKAVLINTTDNIGWANDRGWGYVNLNAAKQAGFYLAGSTGPGSFRLYKGSASGPLYSTLVWNRHVSANNSYFHDLDLYLYSQADSRQLAVSDSEKQNVEQVATEHYGEVVLKVRAFSDSFGGGIDREPFALAVSEDGFSPAEGPNLAARCNAPAKVAPRSTFKVECTAANHGDLALFSTRAALSWRGSSSGSVQDAGNLDSGRGRTLAWTVTAPENAGSYDLQFDVIGNAVGESFGQSTGINFSVSAK